MLDIYHLRKFHFVDYTGLGRLYTNEVALDRYLHDLAEVFDLKALRKFKIVVDCCNGTSSLILRRLADQYGLNVILINERIEGVSFAHEPSINAETVSLQLAPLMKPLGADAGFLFDILLSSGIWIALNDLESGLLLVSQSIAEI